MTSPNEDELLAENLEIKRAADTISILLCQVSRQNRDYKDKIDRRTDSKPWNEGIEHCL